MNVFYAPAAVIGSLVTLDENESSHCTKVLRLKNGDDIAVVNGQGGIFVATIVDAHAKHCTVSVTGGNIHPLVLPHLHLAVAPTKAIDRFEWFVEKSIEIGVGEITPLLCQKSERKQVNDERMERLVVSAMKQSMQPYKTAVNLLTKFSDLVKKCTTPQRFVAHCEDSHKQTLKQLCKPGVDTTILIGPEGDFGPGEIALALSHGFVPVSLGASRLRTETAAVVACHTVVLANE